jgi:hypothetical protein
MKYLRVYHWCNWKEVTVGFARVEEGQNEIVELEKVYGKKAFVTLSTQELTKEEMITEIEQEVQGLENFKKSLDN